MIVVAFLTDPKVLTEILDHLKLPASPPLLAGSSWSAAEKVFNDVPAYDEMEPAYAWDELDAGPLMPAPLHDSPLTSSHCPPAPTSGMNPA
ncbi:MAG: hypothetical protein HY897_26135 [Deltaproteobacteria bacterium]|nr:hypothetical protein [Deltaproteobacteria bacterium]